MHRFLQQKRFDHLIKRQSVSSLDIFIKKLCKDLRKAQNDEIKNGDFHILAIWIMGEMKRSCNQRSCENKNKAFFFQYVELVIHFDFNFNFDIDSDYDYESKLSTLSLTSTSKFRVCFIRAQFRKNSQTL